MSVFRKVNLKKNFPIVLILLLAIFLRFFNYSNRINVSLDQGRDALIGWYSVQNHKAPLIGPPSSSWGFNFGPLYYYFIYLFELLIPHQFAPWIGFTILSIVSVYLIYKIGEHSQNKTFGIIAAIITAISFAEIENSANLLNTALVSFAVFLSFHSLSQVIYQKRIWAALLVGFGVGLAINSHLQSMPIISLIFITPCVYSGHLKDKLKILMLVSLGLLASLTPILYFESQHHFAWIKSLIDYTLHGQQKFYTPVRWLTEFTRFWPGQFGRVIFGDSGMGLYVIVFLILGAVLTVVKKYTIPKVILIALIVFILEIFSVRYYKGPRSPEYFIFLHFFVIIFFSWSLSVFVRANKIMGAISLLAIFSLVIVYSLPLMSQSSHAKATLEILGYVKRDIAVPVRLVMLPDSHENAYSLYYFLLKAGLGSPDGRPLAVCDNHDSLEKHREVCLQTHRLFVADRFVLYDFSSFDKTDLTLYPPTTISPEILYKRTYNNYELEKF